jgi:hypothetical protein
MNMAFLLAGTTNTNPVLVILGLLPILAWKNAGHIGLDYSRVAEPAAFERAQSARRWHLLLAGRSAGSPIRAALRLWRECARAARLSAGQLSR